MHIIPPCLVWATTEVVFHKTLARCTLYSMPAIVQAFHNSPSKESLLLTVTGVNSNVLHRIILILHMYFI